MTMYEWFDPHNIEHCKAYNVLMNTGMWPKKFWDDMMAAKVVLPASWQALVTAKIADAWIEMMLGKGS